MTYIENPHSTQAPLSALVASYHGLDEDSRLIVQDALCKALLPLCPTLDVLRSFSREKVRIYLDATLRLRQMLIGQEKSPSGPFPPLERMKYWGGYRRVLDDASKRVAEDAIIAALAPLVTTAELARAARYDDYLIIEVTREIERRLRAASKEARNA